MKKKSIVKMVVDILMLILMLLEYSKVYTGQLLHETIGIILFGLFLLHNILNINFYKNLFKGEYNLRRIITTFNNLIFSVCMPFTIILGIPISQEVFKFLGLNGNMQIRKLHTIFGYWGLVILSVHLGMHFRMMFFNINKKLKGKNILKSAIYLVELLIVVCGIKIMIDTNLGSYLVGKASFGVVTGNIFTSLLNNFVIILSIGLIVYNLDKLFFLKKKK